MQSTSERTEHWPGAMGPASLNTPYEIGQATYLLLHFSLPPHLVYSGYKHMETGASLTISIRKASKSGLLFNWGQCSAGIQ